MIEKPVIGISIINPTHKTPIETEFIIFQYL